MPVTEVVHHPLVSETAQDRELYHKQYTMHGLQELQTIIYNDPSVSNSGAYFTIKPPLGNTLVDRNILLELTVTVQLPGAGGFGSHFCPKSMPANRMIDTCNLKINSSSVLSEPGRYLSVLSQYKTNQEFIKKFRSLSPTEPDIFNRYENYDLNGSINYVQNGVNPKPAAPGAVTTALLALDYANNPYSPFRNASQSGQEFEPRGAFPFSYDAATRTRTYVFTEPLLNPFCMPRENTAVAHVTDISLQLNFTSNLDRAFSGVWSFTGNPYTPAGGAGNLAGAYNQSYAAATTNLDPLQGGFAAGLTYTITKARLITKVATASIPLSVKQYVNYNEFQFNFQTLGKNDGTAGGFSGGAITSTFNAVRLPCIPSHIYIFARPQPSSQKRFTADAFLAIQSISITCMNKTGILSAMTPQQLYNISAENGINMSWNQWSKRVGSILCLAFGKDIVQLLPGVNETLDFSFTITMKDTTHYDTTGAIVPQVNMGDEGATLLTATNDTSITWELCMLSVFPASMTVSEGMAIKQIGISPAEAQDAINAGPSMETLNEVNQAVGGGFSDWLNRNSHKAWTGVKKYAGPVAQAANALAAANPALAPMAQAANMVSSAVGSGSYRRTRGGGLLLN